MQQIKQTSTTRQAAAGNPERAAAFALGADVQDAASFAAGTRIATLRGLVEAADLQPGERVITRRGVDRLEALRRIPCAEAGQVTFVLLPAGCLGPNRPLRDTRVPAAQRLHVSGSCALSAGAFAESPATSARYCEAPDAVVELRFARDVVLQAEDLQVLLPQA